MRTRVVGLIRGWIWIVFFVLPLGCGSTDTTVSYADDPDGKSDLSDASGMQDTGGNEGDTKVKPDQVIPSGTRYRLIPLHNPDAPAEVGVDKVVQIQIQVMDLLENDIEASYPVAITVNETTPPCAGEECGVLLSNEALTNDHGVATVGFKTNQAQNFKYRFKATGPEADPVFVEFFVVPVPLGDIKVVFSPNEPSELAANPSKINVRVGKGHQSCSNFNPVHPWDEVSDEDLVGQKTVSGLASTPIFEGLPTDEDYYVFATATMEVEGHDQLVVYGCADMVHLIPQDEGKTQVTLNLNDVYLDPAGTYDMVNHIDFSDAIPGQAGEIIDLIEMVFYNPGAAILTGIKELVSLYISPAITDLAFSLFEDALGNYITNMIFTQAPPEILQFFEAGQELLQIVNNLELYGELKLSKASNIYNIQGVETWYGISLYWTWGCPEEDEPDYDPECGKYSFGTDDLGDTEFPLDLVAGQFHAQISGFDRLIIDQHPLQLNYGKLILFVLNNLILQNLTQYEDLSELLDAIVDCEDLANNLSSNILDGIGISEQDLLSYCETVENTFLAPVESAIGGLSLPSTITLNGDCRMRDDDGDLKVDRLVQGVWTGYISTMNANGVPETLPLLGDFSATKATYPAP